MHATPIMISAQDHVGVFLACVHHTCHANVALDIVRWREMSHLWPRHSQFVAAQPSNTCACMCGTMPFWQASFIGAGIAYGCALVGLGAYCTVRACDHAFPHNTIWPNFAAGYRGDDIVDDSTPIVVRMDACHDNHDAIN